jgi:hypothetical protein
MLSADSSDICNAIGSEYILVRLSGPPLCLDGVTLDKELFKEGMSISDVPNIMELNDGTCEITVRNSHLLKLQDIVDRVFPGRDIQSDYDPTTGSTDDVDTWGSETAGVLNTAWFLRRTQLVVNEGWPVSAACYYYFVNCKGLGTQIDAVSVLNAVRSLITCIP